MLFVTDDSPALCENLTSSPKGLNPAGNDYMKLDCSDMNTQIQTQNVAGVVKDVRKQGLSNITGGGVKGCNTFGNSLTICSKLYNVHVYSLRKPVLEIDSFARCTRMFAAALQITEKKWKKA